MDITPTTYRWPNLSPITRTYVVCDQDGRYGIAYADHRGAEVIFAHPCEMPDTIAPRPDMGLPGNAILLTATAFHRHADGSYRGTWCDHQQQYGQIPEADLKVLTVVSDLGYIMPDRWADQALAGSDAMGHWDYGARLGKVGGQPPVEGQLPSEMTAAQAEAYAKEVGETVTARGLRFAARRGYIPGARKVGRDWLIPYAGLNQYLDNRPNPGPRAQTV